MRGVNGSSRLHDLLTLLLRAGELECALSDVGSPNARRAADLSNIIAESSLCCDAQNSFDASRLRTEALAILASINDNPRVSISTPEGFAYYALHPLDYADLVAKADVRCPSALVLGLRSIGTTLSSVVTAKFRQLGIDVQRTTIRPAGHPYDRHCTFDELQRQQIRTALSYKAVFVVCDEGPGRSGSSLLSVAEALEREDVPANCILILCSHHPDLNALSAPDAARRWSRYRVLASGMTRRLPSEAGEDVGGGRWREKFLNCGETWPAAWTQLERPKYLSRDGRQLLKFEGYGHFGQRIKARNEALAASGFGGPYCGQVDGFGRHPLLGGRQGRSSDLSRQLLRRMAEYCAWRAREFAVSQIDTNELQTMAQANHERQFDNKLEVDLTVKRPAICDGRMQPHEWFLANDGGWLKLDGAAHGDDHFFPGPCDIAWDLAGATVEWELDTESRQCLLSHYVHLTGDDVATRIEAYELAYATFRFAWSKVAADSMRGTADEERLLRDYRRYVRWSNAVLQRQTCHPIERY